MALTIIRRSNEDDGDITILMTITSTYTLGDGETIPSTSSRKHTTEYVTKTLIKSVAAKTSTSTSKEPSNSSSSSQEVPQLEVSSSSLNESFDTEIAATTTVSRETPSTSQLALSLSRGFSDSGKSTKLGLAIGLPVAIFSVFLIIIIGFFVMKRKGVFGKEKMVMNYSGQYYNYSEENKGGSPLTKLEKSGFDEKKTDATENIRKIVLPLQMQLTSESEYSLSLAHGTDKRAKRQSLGNFFRDRLSKVIRIQDIQDEESQIETTILTRTPLGMPGQKSLAFSPLFLRRFHLGKGKDPVGLQPSSSIKPQVISVPLEEPEKALKLDQRRKRDGQYFSKNKSKLNLPPIVASDISLDPGVRRQIQYLVVKDYSKKLDDELSITVGQRAFILRLDAAGWCKAKLLRTGEEGIVPINCLQKIE
ncbi:uncharacterized protein RJT20DRAFT_141439 [Scheffersomyces xylosifermentans]|uniref:uncharacterized protein n=1 Tax=Scheffersomyces xylosifermentans TaxID=1304137 RepID=UPI00315DC73C